MVTQLGKAIAKTAPAASSAPSRFMAALAGKRVLKPITIPSLGLEAVMTLLGSDRLLDIDGDVVRAMERRGLSRDDIMNLGRFELETAKRALAEAVLELGDPPTKPLGTVEEWGGVTPEVIGDLWRQYGDLREEHDPASAELTSEEILDLRGAVSKKNGVLLRVFGARKLSAYLLTLGDQPAISSTPRSSPGDSWPES